MGAPPANPVPMGGPQMGMTPYANQMSQMSQQMAGDITAAAANSTKKILMIVGISIVAVVLLSILITVFAFMRTA
jgi:hypothetical protein